jgi:5-methylcytosine-specific restriction enzyme subunit McrC
MQRAIPILNVFYLFCYAWRLAKEGRTLVVGAESSPNAETLFARVLLNAMQLLLRRGLEKGYSVTQDDIGTVRGRILLFPTFQQLYFKQNKVRCVFDELDHDNPNNRIIKATLFRLCRAPSVDPGVRFAISGVLARLNNVSTIHIDSSAFGRVRLHSNNAYYDLSLKLCELIYRHLLPSETVGRYRFSNLLGDEERMSAIFEEFVRVFYQTEAKDFHSVKREDVLWDADEMDATHRAYLPKMQTDATLRSKERTIIVDAKYYKSIFTSFKGAEKIRTAHLYQMSAYLRNCDLSPSGPVPEGLLLYPSSNEALNLDYRLCGHKIRIATVDLHIGWEKIEQRLHQLIA